MICVPILQQRKIRVRVLIVAEKSIQVPETPSRKNLSFIHQNNIHSPIKSTAKTPGATLYNWKHSWEYCLSSILPERKGIFQELLIFLKLIITNRHSIACFKYLEDLIYPNIPCQFLSTGSEPLGHVGS